MEKFHEPLAFADILISKGYNSIFVINGAFPGLIRQSISDYMQSHESRGVGNSSKFRLSSYLSWTSDDKPYIICHMGVANRQGKLNVENITIEKRGGNNQLLKCLDLTDLSTISLPTTEAAIAMVSDTPAQSWFAKAGISGTKTENGQVMKKLRIAISNWFDRLEEQWRVLPLRKQHRYTLLLFAGYALLSVVVLLKVCYDVGTAGNDITIEHIENRVIQQKKFTVPPPDSISKILKNKTYER